ncbi:hypothetical protein ACXVUM_07165 [Williamsia sp. SKLECPSW1]
MSKATTVATTALGVLTPWSAPVRLLAARRVLAARRDRTPGGPIPTPRARRARRRRSRLRTVAGVSAIGAVVAVGAVVVVRSRTHTPPPVAPSPPRVQDVPTADAAETGPAPE